MTRRRSKSLAFLRRAAEVMPQGVSSNFRYWGDEASPVVARGQGCYVWDMDGNRYIDYRLGFGPVILGHGYPEVVERVAEAIKEGTIFASTHPWEVKVAERIIHMCPAVDWVRFANSGAEATMHALRIARGYTGREKIIKFEGQYHGMYDYMLFSTASAMPGALGARRDPIPLQQSSGIPRSIRDLVITVPFNDFGLLENMVEQSWPDVAAIIVEPILGNVASIEPRPGFLEQVRQLCDEYDIVLIFDEVKTGFRIAPGGAQEVYEVLPDLTTYAKAMANGFPAAAIGGREELREVIGYGQVAQGGTYCGNVAGLAAADATLELLENGQILETISQRGERLKEGLSRILTKADIPHLVSGPPSMFGILLTEAEEIHDLRDFDKTNSALYEEIVMALVERGAIPDPDVREPWFLCYSHSDADIDETLTYFEEAVKEVKRG
jgi:glutamate-1-semialdehyde 2,1-aminomutase